MPANPNREGGSNIEEAKLTLEEVASEDVNRPNNQLVTYHRRFPDGKYVPVYLSLGFRFDAEDDELIKYLNKRINEAEATCIFIPTVDVYKHSPEELAQSYQSMERDERYFFSSRDRKYLNGNRPDRAAGNGYWKATGADKKIYHNGEYIGSNKCLVFYEGKPPKGRKTCWVMQEYVADQPTRQRRGPDDMRLDDCVLCRIDKNSDCSPKSEKQTAASESGPQLNLGVQQPTRPAPQLNLQVLQPNLENIQVLQSDSPTPQQSNKQCHMPTNPNREGGSNIEEAKLTLEEVASEDVNRPNNQLVTYHMRFPDGKYVPVYLSLGFRFDPEDDELIKYLNKRINEAEATCIFIPTVDVYKHSPEELAQSHQSVEKDERYFFSSRNRKYLNGNRPDRAAGNGYWKATGPDKKLYHNGEYIGSKMVLVFYEGKPPKGRKTHWVMQEYVADQPKRQRRGPDDMRLDDCVLCRIYKKSDCSPKREKQTAASECGPQLNLEVQQPSRPAPQLNLQMLQPNLENIQVLQPNPATPQQNLEAIQYSRQAGSHNLGGPLDCQSENIPEDTKQIHVDNLENNHGPFSDLTPMDMAGNLTQSPVFRYLPIPDQKLNYFNPHQLMDRFKPDFPFDNDDFPPDYH